MSADDAPQHTSTATLIDGFASGDPCAFRATGRGLLLADQVDLLADRNRFTPEFSYRLQVFRHLPFSALSFVDCRGASLNTCDVRRLHGSVDLLLDALLEFGTLLG